MKVKPIDQITSKWAQRAGAAGQAYTDGVRSPKASWSTQTAAAADNYAQGVQAAVANGRFKAGVTAAGDQKWQNGAVNKGAARYPQGVAAAQPAFNSGIQKFVTALTNATLPPKFPKGSPNNQARSNFVATLLRSVKLGTPAPTA